MFLQKFPGDVFKTTVYFGFYISRRQVFSHFLFAFIITLRESNVW